MIVVLKKNNIALVVLIFLLSIAIYSLNMGIGKTANTTAGGESVKTVLLDPGHGGEDPGAVSDYSGIGEKEINLNIAMRVKQILEKENFKVIMTRQEDKLEYSPETRNIIAKRREDLTRRKKMMDEGGADIVVSIHLNKFKQTQYSGAQTFFPPNSADSQRLASSIQKSLRDMVDPKNTREALVKKEPIIILKNNKTTTAIVECGFLSNQEEEMRLATATYQENLALAISNGIKTFFEK